MYLPACIRRVHAHVSLVSASRGSLLRPDASQRTGSARLPRGTSGRRRHISAFQQILLGVLESAFHQAITAVILLTVLPERNLSISFFSAGIITSMLYVGPNTFLSIDTPAN